MTRCRRLGGGVLAVLVVAGLVGCSDGDSDADADDRRVEQEVPADDDGPAPFGDDGPTAEAEGTGTGDGGWHGALVREPAARPDFTLTDTRGRPYDFRAATAGKLTLLFFGYTSCPDICPLHLATLSMALDEPGMPDPVVVFVTTDPDRDTPERLREWLDNFDEDIVGLTGTREEIRRAEDAALVDPSFYADRDGQPVESPDTDVNYEVGHAAQMIAYTSDDLTHIVYPYGIRRDDWEADLPRLAAGWPAGT